MVCVCVCVVEDTEWARGGDREVDLTNLALVDEGLVEVLLRDNVFIDGLLAVLFHGRDVDTVECKGSTIQPKDSVG